MPSFSDLLKSAKKPLLWLDDTAYSTRLLAGGRAPWLDVAQLLAWRRKAQGLLKPDIAVVDGAALCAAWVEAHPQLRSAMMARKRMTAPLRTLLAEEDLRAHAADALSAVRASFVQPLALVLPSPRLWVALAHAQAFGERPSPGADEADSAAVYVADFLRSFGQSGLDVLLLCEDEATAPAQAEEAGWYQPVWNLAQHYRWSAGLLTPGAAVSATGLDFVIAAGGSEAVRVPQSFWTAGASAPACAARGLRYASIPGDAQPETVLEKLAALRD